MNGQTKEHLYQVPLLHIGYTVYGLLGLVGPTVQYDSLVTMVPCMIPGTLLVQGGSCRHRAARTDDT